MTHWKTKNIKSLIDTIASFKNEDEASAFLRDLATISELEAMAERWGVAQMIHKGITYREINKKTGVSTATITRVARWMKNGEGGYGKMIEKKG